MIKNNEVKEGSTAKNIGKAAKKLAYLNMDEAERKQYENYLINLHREEDILDTAREEGEKKGEKKQAIKTACQMKKDGMSSDLISKYTGLSVDEVEALDCG
jgi:predicted transposase/invertase (TIGR01784 family)